MEVYELKPYGYCFGVIQAIELIKEVKQKHYDKNIYVFGMLVHNNDVVTYLNSLGVTTIDTNSIDKIQKLKEFTSDDVVVFTAHLALYIANLNQHYIFFLVLKHYLF